MGKKHTYVSFTDRVASIRIDPIRRGEQKRLAPNATDTTSLFVSALERWNELNLSSSYTSFSSECSPFAESLAMLLYNQEKVFDILITAIKNSDEHGMEPLLDILVNFARDLGEDFEPFYPRAVETCIELVLQNQRNDKMLETVELAFNCLASMFKFLARLIVQNLIPTYDLLLPLFGGVKAQKQRSFILRFAAESMAFLVRRAQKENLTKIVYHIVEKVVEDKSNEQYIVSSMMLFATTLKGPGTTLHSKTPSLITTYYESCHKFNAGDLISHILVDGLHHAREDTAAPIYSTILPLITDRSQGCDPYSARCLYVITGLRKGDRVADFSAIFDALLTIGNASNLTPASLEYVEACSAALCFSDKVTCHRYIEKILAAFPDMKALAKLIEMVNMYDHEFASTIGSEFITAISEKLDASSESDLKVLALLIHNLPVLHGKTNGAKLKKLGLIEKLKIRDDDSATSIFNLWWSLLVEPLTSTTEVKTLLNKVLKLNFSYSKTLSAFHSNVVALIYEQAPDFKATKDVINKTLRLTFTPRLMDSLKTAIARSEEIDESIVLNAILGELNVCLISCDKSYRESALNLLKLLLAKQSSDADPQFLLDQCSVINDLPLDLENARNISHRLRQLASKFNIANQGSSITSEVKIVNDSTLSFILGMLSVRLQPVSTAVISVMPKLAESAPQPLCEKLLYIIEHNSRLIDPSSFMIDQGISAMEVEDTLPEYQHLDCNTLDSLQTCGDESWGAIEGITDTLESEARKSVEFAHYDDLRSLCIKALCEVPQVAERFAIKHLVLPLLSAREDEETGFEFKDQVSLLELFAKLKNPQQLPNFTEVYGKYQYFLSSRHSPLQKLGLSCLLTTNTSEVKVLRKYKSNFYTLLDDKAFSDELTSFVCTGDDQKDETSLHPDDEDTIMPFLIRVLYGRAQNVGKRNMRHAVMSSLLFFDQKFITMFIRLAYEHLHESEAVFNASASSSNDVEFDFDIEKDEESSKAVTEEKMERDISRKYQGYLSLIHDFVHHLKGASEPTIPMICEEGIFPILKKLNLRDDKSLRQSVTKDLDEMLSSVPKFNLWEPLFPFIYEHLISPQLENYGARNLENLSTVAKLALTLSTEPELITFITEDIALSIVSCLSFDLVKEVVVSSTLKLVINLATNAPQSSITRSAISSLVQFLPKRMEEELTPETFSIAVTAINKMFALGVDKFDAEVIHNLAEVSFSALQKPSRIIPLHIKGSLLLALSQILSSPNCSIDIIKRAYYTLAPLFRQFSSPDARIHLSSCYYVFGERIPEFRIVGELIVELNSFDKKRLGDPDFERRGAAFELINEKIWSELTADQWLPLVFNMLFFIRDPEELALRTNGRYSLLRVIESLKAREVVVEHVLPAIKKGLRDDDDKYRRTYIDLLGQCAKYDVLPTLNILLYNGDEEADFFVNINHVQVHRRRRAIQRLAKHASELDSSVIAHYLLSIVENCADYSGNKNNDLNNLADDALHAITELLRNVSEGQFKSVARRCVKDVKLNPEPAKIRKAIRVVTSVAQATPSGIDEFVLNALVNPLHAILTEKSNEHENLPDRVPISVAIVYFMKALRLETLELQLPGKLTALCQLLRSKIPEMRDTVRQSLSRIVKALGAKFLLFLVSELSGALNRGGLQSHVLGFTVHSLLVELNREDGLQIGDTDDSAQLIFSIVMKDTFGTTGEEKDNEGYVTTAKEVKQHKSYDTAEILASATSLSQFGKIFLPIRNYLSSTKLTAKGEHKVSEVLRRIASGLHKNPLASTQDAVVMGYEIFSKCKKTLDNIVENSSSKKAKQISGNLAARMAAAKESEEFFTVRLSSRDWYETGQFSSSDSHAQNMKYAPVNFHLLQTFALDTLRGVLTSTSGGAASDEGKGLLTVANVRGLLPIIVESFESTHEDMNMASLRLATTSLRLPVSFAEGDDTLQVMSNRTLHFIESSPDTNSLICQASLKFLTMLLRSKGEFELSTGSVAYIIERITPDLEEPERQGTAISFLRAIFTRMVMLPQVYDAADTLSKIMITNQSDHIRVNCRAAYLQFISSYPLGQTRLDRQLKFLGSNLRYPTPSGRISVMDMIDSLLHKINVSQLESAFLQWYASLVLTLVSDSEPECRSRASSLLSTLIISVKSSEIFNQMVEYCLSWMKSLGKNDLLVQGGLEVSKFFLQEDVVNDKISASAGELERLKSQQQATVTEVLKSGQRHNDHRVDWQLIYIALDTDVSNLMNLVEEVLLFPHPWVRARAARVFGHYFKSTPKEDIALDLLVNVGQKLVRQLGAPRLQSNDSLQIVKDLVFIVPIWDSQNAMRAGSSGKEELCIDWLVNKLSSLVRTDVSAEDHIGTKTGAIQVLASLPSLVKAETTERLAKEVVRCLFILNDQLTSEDTLEDLRNLAEEAMSIYDRALGTTEYLKCYTAAKRFVDDRRRERRTKRSIQAVAEPALAAQKRLKKNSHKREVRKHKKHVHPKH